MAFALNVRDIMRAGSALTDERDKPLHLIVGIEMDAPDAVLVALEESLRPRTARAFVEVGVVGESAPGIPSSADAVIVVLGSGGTAGAYLSEARNAGVPVVTLALHGVSTAGASALHQPLDDFLTEDDAMQLVREDLGRWLADRIEEKRLALAAAFDFMRANVSGEYVKQTAWQNALIGGVVIIPGADMPLMTGNQAKMVLQIAAAYGEKLDTERAKELIAVVGGGLAFRAIARQLVAFVPGFGWAVKAGVGYTGTLAMGKAAIAYFEQGADMSAVVRRLGEGASQARRRARVTRRPAEPALPAPAAEPVPYKVEAARGDVPSV